MTKAEWLSSGDPSRMIDALESLGYGPLLWDFAIAACRRNWHELPGEPFRRVMEHVERVGIRDEGDALLDASKALEKLERRLRKADDSGDASRLNRQMGFGGMVLDAFEQQDGASAARSISGGLLEWAADKAAEARLQADALRRLVPNPFPAKRG